MFRGEAQMQDRLVCPVCWDDTAGPACRNVDVFLISCQRCDKYKLSSSLVGDQNQPNQKLRKLDSDVKRAIVAHWLRSEQRSGTDEPKLTSQILDELIEGSSLPSLDDQRRNVIRLIGEKADAPEDQIVVDIRLDQYVVGAGSHKAVEAILQKLVQEGLVKFKPSGEPNRFIASLTFDGWREFEQIVG